MYKPKWKEYKEKCGGGRNISHYQCLTGATLALSKTRDVSGLEKILMHMLALYYSTVQCEVDLGKKDSELVRVIGNLPCEVRETFEGLVVGEHMGLPSATSTSRNEKADSAFMGKHPGYAVQGTASHHVESCGVNWSLPLARVVCVFR